MANDWILDVLADLKTYAKKNGLSVLAEQLEDTALVAAAEIASMEGKAPTAAVANAGTTGHVY
ncbi:MAG: hypothetical protein QNJ16_19290 [Rhodobacter sp.]|nr:hypothetical protein [Rhodobacter sp.]